MAIKNTARMKCLLLGTSLLWCFSSASGQESGDTTQKKDPKSKSIQWSGYFQPQFQWISEKGAHTFADDPFPKNTNNRFALRRSRIALKYHFETPEQALEFDLKFQIQANGEGLETKDIWIKVSESKWRQFSLTAGIFSRPFGFEATYSSSRRESPERGRMSQTLMDPERALGVMLSFAPRSQKKLLKNLRLHLAVLNGPGIHDPVDLDSYKDLVTRAELKPISITSSGWLLSGGLSILYGAIGTELPFYFKMSDRTPVFDSLYTSNQVTAMPRHYYGVDAQLKIPHRVGRTEIRAEYIRGNQPGLQSSSETPLPFPTSASDKPQPFYLRTFDGAYIYFIQNIFSEKHEIAVKYDWYDPNVHIKGKEISGKNNVTAAEICYKTLGIGYTYHYNKNFKATAFFEWVANESTALPDYEHDVSDNVLTLRLQYRFGD